MVDDQDTPVKSGSVNNRSQSSKDKSPGRRINLMLVWWTNIKISSDSFFHFMQLEVALFPGSPRGARWGGGRGRWGKRPGNETTY